LVIQPPIINCNLVLLAIHPVYSIQTDSLKSIIAVSSPECLPLLRILTNYPGSRIPMCVTYFEYSPIGCTVCHDGVIQKD